MQVLLINQNATIERLVKLSSGKLGYELTSAKDISEVENSVYGFIIMDSDLYNDEEFALLKQKFGTAKYILIITKGAERPNGFDVYIEKPFLPTELVDIFSSLSSEVSQNTQLDESIFDNADTALDSFDEDAIFGLEDEPKAEMPGELDDFPPMSLEEDEKEEVGDFGDIEFSLDEPEKHGDDTSLAEEDDSLDEYQINLDEQMQNINEEAKEIDFSSDEDIALDLGNELNTLEIADNAESESEDLQEFENEELLLEDKANYEDDIDMDSLPMVVDDEPDDELSGLDDISLDEDDLLSETNKDKAHIFDEDEVNKLKNLLDETEEEKLENEDFDLENIKIHNDELGSLTEESLAEALGVNMDNMPISDEMDDIEKDINNSSNLLEDSMPDVAQSVATTTTASTNMLANAIELNPNQSITISLEALKELLNMADVTINITLSKKQ